MANDGVGVGAEEGDEAGGLDLAWIESVRKVYESERSPLWRSLVGSYASTDVADEAVAEAFTQLLRRGRVVRDPAAWVWRTAFRVASGELHRRRVAGERSLQGSGVEVASQMVGPLGRLPDEAIDLTKALSTLSEQQRRCVALVDIGGHTAPSAAAILDTSAATVRVQLMRARQHLRVLLADHAPRNAPTPHGPDGTPALQAMGEEAPPPAAAAPVRGGHVPARLRRRDH